MSMLSRSEERDAAIYDPKLVVQDQGFPRFHDQEVRCMEALGGSI